MDLFDQLREVAERKETGVGHPLYLKNRTYYLCLEDRFLPTIISMWMDNDKLCPMTIRSAKENIDRCTVVVVQDKDGEYLDFITRITAICRPRVVVK